jgi:hypothetical protein
MKLAAAMAELGSGDVAAHAHQAGRYDAVACGWSGQPAPTQTRTRVAGAGLMANPFIGRRPKGHPL